MADTLDPRSAWQPFKPSKSDPWDLKKASHLYRRAAFGATYQQLQDAVEMGPERTTDLLLSGRTDAEFEQMTASLAETIAQTNNSLQGRAWWLYRMAYGPHPVREKITLFWHNHFATSNAKIQNMRLMLNQYSLMHKYAMGNFAELLQEISRDAAMIVWLDTNQSRKGMPNENYARELMELFSLGIGHYTEGDIREAARAFTGWEIRDAKGFFNPEQHDATPKTVLGQTGSFQGKDIVDICLKQPACAPFIVNKMFRYLVSETIQPTPELLAPLVEQFRKDFDTGKLVSTIVRSRLFYSQAAYRSRVKGPVEFVLGIVRGLEGRRGTTALVGALEQLGQNIFYPPSVKGWDGGTTWLNGQTLLYRQNLALALTSTEDPRFAQPLKREHRSDPVVLAERYGAKTDEQKVDLFLNLFLAGDTADGTRERLLDYMARTAKQSWPVYWTPTDATEHRTRALCHLVLTLPEFQLS